MHDTNAKTISKTLDSHQFQGKNNSNQYIIIWKEDMMNLLI